MKKLSHIKNKKIIVDYLSKKNNINTTFYPGPWYHSMKNTKFVQSAFIFDKNTL
tara:strand:+ start:285 stop:446 length:162 start_codon:yes stop_codon:yes gene_type:complete